MKHIIGNWKMNLGIRESAAMARTVLRELRGKECNPHLILAPSHTALSEVRKVLVHSRVHMAAQSAATQRSGALTGQVSSAMLEDVGATHAIVNHPEHIVQGDRLEHMLAIITHLFTTPVQPIIYIGHSIEQESGLTVANLRDELSSIVSVYRGAPQRPKQKLFLVLEPTFVSLSPDSAPVQLVADTIQDIKAELAAQGVAAGSMVVCYGGHIDAENVHQFLREPSIDGLAIGATSIKPNQFTSIIATAREIITAQQ